MTLVGAPVPTDLAVKLTAAVVFFFPMACVAAAVVWCFARDLRAAPRKPPQPTSGAEDEDDGPPDIVRLSWESRSRARRRLERALRRSRHAPPVSGQAIHLPGIPPVARFPVALLPPTDELTARADDPASWPSLRVGSHTAVEAEEPVFDDPAPVAPEPTTPGDSGAAIPRATPAPRAVRADVPPRHAANDPADFLSPAPPAAQQAKPLRPASPLSSRQRSVLVEVEPEPEPGLPTAEQITIHTAIRPASLGLAWRKNRADSLAALGGGQTEILKRVGEAGIGYVVVRTTVENEPATLVLRFDTAGGLCAIQRNLYASPDFADGSYTMEDLAQVVRQADETYRYAVACCRIALGPPTYGGGHVSDYPEDDAEWKITLWDRPEGRWKISMDHPDREVPIIVTAGWSK